MRLIAVLIVTTIALVVTTSAFADIPRTINYQGKLTDSESRAVDDGSYSITFNLYEQEAGGAPIWFEDQTIVVQKGIFSTQIGATKDLNLIFDKPYWLGIKVGADSEMSPRQPLSSTAYAFQAARASIADTLTNISNIIPHGVILPWAGSETNVPDGWLICDEREISRINYSDLFNVIATTYGVGNNSTTFNIPDLRGRFLLGKDNMGGTNANRVTSTEADNLGQGAGKESHILTIEEMPSHNHGIFFKTETGGKYKDRVINFNNGGTPQITFSNTGFFNGQDGIETSGNNTAHNNMNPYLTLNWIIKI